MKTCARCGGGVNRHGAKGLCASCYQRRRREEYQKNPWRICDADGCARFTRESGTPYCELHYTRVRRHGTPGSAQPSFVRGEGSISSTGYRIMRVDGRSVPEHRLILERALGRSLWDWENVHHKNGLRADNRLENLEIWIVPQPFGQRPEDLLIWCEARRAELETAAAWNRSVA